MSGQPFPKTLQLGDGRPRRYRRKVADARGWQRLRTIKGGPCRVCGEGNAETCDLHHVVPRSSPWFGDDVPDNLVPLCRACHELVERRGDVWTGRGRRGHAPRKHPAAVELVVSLSDAEYAYAVERGGEAFWERHYGIRYSRA